MRRFDKWLWRVATAFIGTVLLVLLFRCAPAPAAGDEPVAATIQRLQAEKAELQLQLDNARQDVKAAVEGWQQCDESRKDDTQEDESH